MTFSCGHTMQTVTKDFAWNFQVTYTSLVSDTELKSVESHTRSRILESPSWLLICVSSTGLLEAIRNDELNSTDPITEGMFELELSRAEKGRIGFHLNA